MSVDVAFLDIEMGGMNGLELAVRIKQLQPDAHIVFVTGYERYAVDAFRMHATGYLLKPVDEQSLRRELTFMYGPQVARPAVPHVRVQTFGGFEVFVDGRPVRFARAKSKELLAYLVDRRGAGVSAAQASAVLFDDDRDSGARKSYVRTIIAGMKAALRETGVEDMLVAGLNALAVAPDRFDCDYYRLLRGDPVAINEYRDDYLPDYDWAAASPFDFDW